MFLDIGHVLGLSALRNIMALDTLTVVTAWATAYRESAAGQKQPPSLVVILLPSLPRTLAPRAGKTGRADHDISAGRGNRSGALPGDGVVTLST
jgi:hypothetical protein